MEKHPVPTPEFLIAFWCILYISVPDVPKFFPKTPILPIRPPNPFRKIPQKPIRNPSKTPRCSTMFQSCSSYFRLNSQKAQDLDQFSKSIPTSILPRRDPHAFWRSGMNSAKNGSSLVLWQSDQILKVPCVANVRREKCSKVPVFQHFYTAVWQTTFFLIFPKYTAVWNRWNNGTLEQPLKILIAGCQVTPHMDHITHHQHLQKQQNIPSFITQNPIQKTSRLARPTNQTF